MSVNFGDTPPPYQIMPGDGYITIRITGSPGSESIKQFMKSLSEHMKDPHPHVVINCETAASLSHDWVRELLKMQKDLRVSNKGVRFILVNGPFAQDMKRQGLDTAFKVSANLREALVEFGLVSKKTLNTDFINPFLDATLHVLKVQASVDAKTEKIKLKNGDENMLGDISGVIGIVSETFNGSVVICFPEKTFLAVMSNMLGENYTEMNQEIIDGAGEITNMIFGQAKIVLNDKGYGIKTAIPSVVTGKNHTLQSQTKGPIVVIPFSSSAGQFFVEICLSN